MAEANRSRCRGVEQTAMNRNCEICGRFTNCDLHHIFNGAFRKKSEDYRATIYVCRECHELIHRNAGVRINLKAKYQQIIMERTGMNEEQFIKEFGKNYIGVTKTYEN